MTKFLIAILLSAGVAGCTGEGTEPGPDAGCAGETFFPDTDGDGYGDATKGAIQCEATAGFVARGGDCNDTDANT